MRSPEETIVVSMPLAGSQDHLGIGLPAESAQGVNL